jgi:hypothetical protein
MKLPDTQELAKTGLSTAKPYLGTYSIVDGLVRQLLSAVTDLREQQLAGKLQGVEPQLDALCKKFQATMYGQSPEFLASAWNSPGQLGKALVEEAGIGGDTDDAVARLAAKIISDYLAVYIPFEQEAASDDDFQFGLETVVETFSHILLGIPLDPAD